MPWTSADALRHTKKATSGGAKKQWAKVSNSVLARGGSDASAIRQANAVIKNRFGKSSDSPSKSVAKKLGPTKGSGGRSRASASEHEAEEAPKKRAIKRVDPKRLFRSDMGRRTKAQRMRGR